MKFVVFGLSISSAWGNGHATLWRGLARALARLGHRLVFFERDTPYYAENRDLHALAHGELVLYARFDDIQPRARREIADADVAMVTSFCPDGPAAADLVLRHARGMRVFYDLDTPVTLAHLRRDGAVPYLGSHDLSGFDLALSFTGGGALEALQSVLRAPRALPLYGHVDPQAHRPAGVDARYAADLSYIGTYAADRQAMLERLFVDTARRLPARRFLIAGAQYPQDFPWTPNIHFVRHLPPSEHPVFFSSSRLTLNVTRAAMAEMGWCPSGRLFEAAACGAVIVSDAWSGIETFFTPGAEILIARDTSDMLDALNLPDAELRRIGRAARARALAEHTSEHRARTLLAAVRTTRANAEPMEA